MNKRETYSCIIDGDREGPFLKEQIIGMAKSGLIKANSEIVRESNQEKVYLDRFFPEMPDSVKSHVEVDNFRMEFHSMVIFMLKWFFATIPAAIIGFFFFAILEGFLQVYFSG